MIEEDGRVPVLDIGALAKIREGKIAVRGGVARFGAHSVTFEDGKSEPFDAVILATGFKPDLRALLPDAKGVLDAARPSAGQRPRDCRTGPLFCRRDRFADRSAPANRHRR